MASGAPQDTLLIWLVSEVSLSELEHDKVKGLGRDIE